MDALPFLDSLAKSPIKPFYVLHGDEDFLKRQIKEALTPRVIGDGDPDFAVASYLGEQVEFSSVRNELDTLPFLCERRLILIDQADGFVTKYRASLEAFAASPGKAGVLVLDVKSFPGTTKLAKQVPEDCKILCKGFTEYNASKLVPWLTAWAKDKLKKKLSADAARLLMENAGLQMGLLVQELEKLRSYVGDRPSIERADVDAVVGRSRAANVFKILDAVGNGDPKTALTILRELFEEGEDALPILGAMAVSLRRLSQTHYYASRGLPLAAALDRAKVQTWPEARNSAVRQVKHLGGRRLAKIYDWLVETDMGLKGGSPLPPQLQLERLVVRLARPRAG